MVKSNFWVVVAFYNEEKLVVSTLRALSAQTDKNFCLVLVDNNSTDTSPLLVKKYLRAHPELNAVVIHEKQKGTGAAADTGFRYAIQHGARWIARTDADTMPAPDWVAKLKSHFSVGARIIGGKLKPRKDESFYKKIDGIVIPVLIKLTEKAPRFFFKEAGNKYPIFMIPGLNMAIESKLYVTAGGFPRSSIDDTDEDLHLHQRVCKIINKDQAHFAKDAVVYGSIRKVKAYGYIGILLWYWNRKITPDTVDVRL